MERTILILGDAVYRALEVKEVAEKNGFGVLITPALKTAKLFLKENSVSGIVTDNSCYVDEGLEPEIDLKAGEMLMEWLKEHNKQIPVIGNSKNKFKTTYPYYWGQMWGKFDEEDKKIFAEFISSLKA